MIEIKITINEKNSNGDLDITVQQSDNNNTSPYEEMARTLFINKINELKHNQNTTTLSLLTTELNYLYSTLLEQQTSIKSIIENPNNSIEYEDILSLKSELDNCNSLLNKLRKNKLNNN